MPSEMQWCQLFILLLMAVHLPLPFFPSTTWGNAWHQLHDKMLMKTEIEIGNERGLPE
jgi:hypothetical protein